MNIQLLKSQIKDLQYNLQKCNDKLSKIVGEDILYKKIKLYNELIAKQKLEYDVKSKLKEIIDSELQDDAYQRILAENNDENLNDKKKENSNKYWNKIADPKYKDEVEKDSSNNKLMERLNGELDFRIQGHDKKVIMKPFINEDEDEEGEGEGDGENSKRDHQFDDRIGIGIDSNNDYVNIKKFKKHSIPPNDFSSGRLLGKRRNL